MHAHDYIYFIEGNTNIHKHHIHVSHHLEIGKDLRKSYYTFPLSILKIQFTQNTNLCISLTLLNQLKVIHTFSPNLQQQRT